MRRLRWQEYNDGQLFLRMLPGSQTIFANISGDTDRRSKPLDNLLLDGPTMGTLEGIAERPTSNL
jgi:hypothetical protein